MQNGRRETLSKPNDYRFFPGAPEGIIDLCDAADIAVGTSRVFTFGSGASLFEMFVMRPPENAPLGPASADGLVAYVNVCPHAWSPMDWKPGEFLDYERRYIHCTTHGAKFRIDDGICIHGPCIGLPLTPVPIVVANGVVRVAPPLD
ncbi:MAG: Rieske 2Fe-2S domain-containing protein [Proteobacteria bacterium]|nr:Rieske 2Fe-2S domain-containing protein [Pseudomonadota bacterium]MDA1059074.1 Rieske 2Fe-2S domain-containing protein [Pseudomonadota bacterium]